MTDPSITIALIAGGKSSRMGTDKGQMVFRGKALIRHVLDAVSTVSGEVMVISNQPGYEQFGHPVYRDLVPDVGPLGGIVTAMHHAQTDWLLCVACDMPYLDPELLEYLASLRNGWQAVIPFHHGYPEPLCAFYHSSAQAELNQAITDKEFKLQRAYARLRFLHAEIPEVWFEQRNPFSNINTPDDLS